jgi:hypothetical protein
MQGYRDTAYASQPTINGESAMKTLLAAVLLTYCLGLNPAFGQQSDAATAADVKPTDESILQLLEVMHVKTLVDALPQQMDAYYTSFLNKLIEGNQVSAEQQQAIDRTRQNLGAMIRENLNWESMQPIYLEIYGKTFAQSEIDSMIGFYSSPAGRAVVVKMPLVMQNTFAVMQQRMQALMPRIQQMAKDTAAEIKNTKAAAAKPSTG